MGRRLPRPNPKQFRNWLSDNSFQRDGRHDSAATRVGTIMGLVGSVYNASIPVVSPSEGYATINFLELDMSIRPVN